jgi:hypothetical protein
VKDPTLLVGTTVVEEEGSSPSRTSVRRTIYGAEGDLLRSETWNTSYRGETRVVRVGTKPKEPPKKPKPKAGGQEPAPPTTGDETTPPPTRP